MDELKELRNQIDQADSQIIALYKQRMELAMAVGQYKKRRNLPIYNAEREAEVIAERCGAFDDDFLKEGARELLVLLMSQSRQLQQSVTGFICEGYLSYKKSLESRAAPIENPRVIYQGEPGAFGQMAARKHFGNDAALSREPTFEDVFKSVTQGLSDYGVLPVENSLTGSIGIVYDLLGGYECRIVGEETCAIEQNLLCVKDAKISDIREIYSHEQGFLQSDSFLAKHPEWQRNVVGNTATAARMVAESADKSKAAIAGKSACEIYGLEVLESEINDSRANSTRFLIIARDYQLDDRADKVSVLFSVPHEQGSLNKILQIFAAAGLNLLKLESRPKRDENWSYSFFADFSGSLLDARVDDTLKRLFSECLEFKVLGGYKAGI